MDSVQEGTDRMLKMSRERGETIYRSQRTQALGPCCWGQNRGDGI